MPGQARKSAPAKPRTTAPVGGGGGGKGPKKPARSCDPTGSKAKGGKRKSDQLSEEEEDSDGIGGDEEAEARRKIKRGAASVAAAKLQRKVQEDGDSEVEEAGDEDEGEDGEEGMEVTQTPAVDVSKYIRQMDDLKRKNISKREKKDENASMKKLQAIFAEVEEEMNEEQEGEENRKRIAAVTAELEERLRMSKECADQLDELLKGKLRAWHGMEEAFRAYWGGDQKNLEGVLETVVTQFEGRSGTAEEAKKGYEATQVALLSTGTERIQKALDSKSMAHRARRMILA